MVTDSTGRPQGAAAVIWTACLIENAIVGRGVPVARLGIGDQHTLLARTPFAHHLFHFPAAVPIVCVWHNGRTKPQSLPRFIRCLSLVVSAGNVCACAAQDHCGKCCGECTRLTREYTAGVSFCGISVFSRDSSSSVCRGHPVQSRAEQSRANRSIDRCSAAATAAQSEPTTCGEV